MNEPTKQDAPQNVVYVDFKKRAQEASQKEFAKKPSAESIHKFRVFQKWIEAGLVMLLIDGRKKGVVIPPDFVGHPMVRLNFSYRFHLADFRFDESVVCGTLSFPKGQFFCEIPWDAVYGMESMTEGRGTFWPEDAPKEAGGLANFLAQKAKTQDGDSEKDLPGLHLVDNDEIE